MPAPLSRDLRERIVAAIRDGSSMRGAAAWFSVSPSSAIKLMARFRATGRAAPVSRKVRAQRNNPHHLNSAGTLPGSAPHSGVSADPGG